MSDPLYELARLLRPDLNYMDRKEHVLRLAQALCSLATAPFALGGLAWLAAVTHWSLLPAQWLTLGLMGGLMFLLSRLTFFFVIDIRRSTRQSFGHAVNSFEGVVRWSAVFIFGPVALWLGILLVLGQFVAGFRKTQTRDQQWSEVYGLVTNLVTNSLLPLVALTLYQTWGGSLPPEGLTFGFVLRAAGIFPVILILEGILLLLGEVGYIFWQMGALLSPQDRRQVARLSLAGIGIHNVANLFAPLLAGLYVQNGLPLYLVMTAGLLLVAWLVRALSRASEASRQQTQQLEKLEQLGQAILAAPPDGSGLASALQAHAPAMFMTGRMQVKIWPDRVLIDFPDANQGEPLEPAYLWLHDHPELAVFQARDPLPWASASPRRRPVVIAPIMEAETRQLVGGFYLELQTVVQDWSRVALEGLAPTVQSLTDQLSSALQQEKNFRANLAHQKTVQELALARQIQTGFLPREIPQLAGWEFAACLEPARQVSGDFYDLIPLPGGRIGLLIADVADKGVGPALYMALTRTLIRSYAAQTPAQPAEVLQAANRRILEDAGDSLFVTAFYGVLDPATGRLDYANAGHNPPWRLGAAESAPLALKRTGMPLGVDENTTWQAGVLELAPGEMLLLYTDGVTDAQNGEEEFFGVERLLAVGRQAAGVDANQAQAAVLGAVRDFMGAALQFDDITLMIVKRCMG